MDERYDGEADPHRSFGPDEVGAAHRFDRREKRRRRHCHRAQARALKRRARREQAKGSGIFLGIVLIMVGALLGLERLELLNFDSPWRFWPLLLIATGIDKLVQARELGPVHGGLWLLIGGAWLLLRNLRLFGPTFNASWPLLLVGFGIAVVWDSLLTGRAKPRAQGNGGGAA